MKNNPSHQSKGTLSGGVRQPSGCRAFTLIELAVIVVMLAVLSAMLLPALCKAKSQTLTTSCVSNYRQWTVSVNLYANDNRTSLPTFSNFGGGGYLWDVGVNFVTNMAPYGLSVPMWFCPVRPNEKIALEKNDFGGNPILTTDDLNVALNRRYNGEMLIYHSWWVPRLRSVGPPPTYYPTRQPGTSFNNTSDSGYDWPMKTTQKAATQVPFISDLAYSGGIGGGDPFRSPNTRNVSDIRKDTAHFFNGILSSVNLGFIDGHVSTSRPSQISARQPTIDNTATWFY